MVHQKDWLGTAKTGKNVGKRALSLKRFASIAERISNLSPSELVTDFAQINANPRGEGKAA